MRERREIFGTKRGDLRISDLTAEVFAVLNRDTAIDGLGALLSSLGRSNSDFTLEETAIAFDANVLLRLSNHPRNADIIDFLRTRHRGPVLLPGQAIQEFWNSQFQAVESLAVSVKKKFASLKDDVQKVDERFGDFSKRLDGMLEEFGDQFGYIYDEATLYRVQSLLSALKEKALVTYADRTFFFPLAAQRRRTKTPPGFKDDGDGDFFVWIDLLTGLSQLRKEGTIFKRVALVTLDQKIDWSRDGTPHPILSAEMNALTGAHFEVWTIDRLSKELLG